MDETQPSNGQSPVKRIPAREAAALAREGLQELLGYSCESVASILPTEQGWSVTVEVLELERVPSTTDIIGSYVVDLDWQGELVGYDRVRRYTRGATTEQRSSG